VTVVLRSLADKNRQAVENDRENGQASRMRVRVEWCIIPQFACDPEHLDGPRTMGTGFASTS